MDAAFDNIKFELQEETHAPTRIKVIGVGGAGCNAVSRIVAQGPAGAEYYVLNTDPRALEASPVRNKHLLGGKTIGGRGTGANPAVGRQAALDDTEAIVTILEGADLVILAAGLGGGTGTGAAPIIASLAREMNALTIGVVTRPFSFEGPRKMEIAERGLEDLTQVLDNILIVPNDRLLDIAPRGTSFKEALRMVDDVLAQAVNGIGDIVLRPGIINRDFSDVKATLSGMGTVRLGSALSSGPDAVIDAARKAIECPMLDAHGIAGARVVLLHVMGSTDLQLHDVYDATEFIRKAANNPDLHVNLGLSIDESLAGKVQVTVIATSFDESLIPDEPVAEVAVPTPEPVQQPAPVAVSATPSPTVVATPVVTAAAATAVTSTPKQAEAPVEEPKSAETSVPWDEESLDETREVAISSLQADATPAAASTDSGDLFREQPTEVPHAPDIDSGLFDMDDLDTPAFLRHGGPIPD
jgi:cell division protein FtsZ